MPGHAAKGAGHLRKKGFGFGCHQRAHDVAEQGAQHPADNDRIADRDAERPEQRDCPKKPAALFAARTHCVVVGANRAGTGQAAESKVTRQADNAEQHNEQAVGD